MCKSSNVLLKKRHYRYRKGPSDCVWKTGPLLLHHCVYSLLLTRYLMCALDGWDCFWMINWTSSNKKPVIQPAQPGYSLAKAHDELTTICQFSEGTTTTHQPGNDQDGSTVIRWRSQSALVDRRSRKGNRMWLKDTELTPFHTVRTNKKVSKQKQTCKDLKDHIVVHSPPLSRWHTQRFLPLIELILFCKATDRVGLISRKITKPVPMWQARHSSALDTNCNNYLVFDHI